MPSRPAFAQAAVRVAPAISLVGAAFDEARGLLVIVGDAKGAVAQTWEWNGTAWSKANVTAPSGRDEPLLAYDRARKQVVLFGGYRGTKFLNDTWVRGGAGWRRVATKGPPPRGAPAMAYDSRRGRIMLFGGNDGLMGSPLHNDLWEWDGRRWSRIVSDGAAGSPPARALHALAYDEARGRLVLAGGFAMKNGKPSPFDDTWEWDGTAWHQIDVATPGARDHLAMVFAPDRRAIVMHGGANPDVGMVGDTWQYDGKSWTKLLDDGPPRARHHIVYDQRAKSVLLYGGWGPKTQLTELWMLKESKWSRVVP